VSDLLGPRVPDELSPRAAASLRDESDWEGFHVEGDLSGLVARRLDVAECRLTGVALTGADLDGVRLTDTLLEDCELSGAMLHDAVLSRVELRRCRMSGLQLPGAKLRDVTFVDGKLDEANFRMATGERLTFRSSHLAGADFAAARLADVRFFDCDLTRVDYSNARVSGCRLHGSTVEGLRGAQHLGRAAIDPAQVLPFALRLYAALGIVVDDDRDAPPPRR
jgi:uncharacterized protein YjbI with pentapeptide repeats